MNDQPAQLAELQRSLDQAKDRIAMLEKAVRALQSTTSRIEADNQYRDQQSRYRQMAANTFR